MDKIYVDYYLENGEKYAHLYEKHIPCIGDEVRFRGIAYKVYYRIWIYDEKQLRVAIQMKEVKNQAVIQ